MKPTVAARPEDRESATGECECVIIRFPAHGEDRRAWPRLKALLPLPRRLRRCVVIAGRRYWQPG